jgi:DNA-binding MarR family transcriptional regulator
MGKPGFILIPDAVAARPDLTPAQKLILGALGRLQGDKGSCFPSLDYIAEAVGLSKRQVSRLIMDLADRKEIIKLRVPYQSNSYCVPWATARALRKKWAMAKQLA